MITQYRLLDLDVIDDGRRWCQLLDPSLSDLRRHPRDCFRVGCTPVHFGTLYFDKRLFESMAV